MFQAQVYPEDISCIIQPSESRGGIYISNLEAAQNILTLRRFQIRSILTAAKGIVLSHSKSDIPFALYVPAEDHDSMDISKYFPQAVNFISQSLQHTNILVHCLAGVSRSVSLVLAYLIKIRNMNYEEAYALVKNRRKIIHPNDGFIAQLKKWSMTCSQVSKASPLKPSCLTPSPTKYISSYEEYKALRDSSRTASPDKNPQFYKREGFSPSKTLLQLRKIHSLNERPHQYQIEHLRQHNRPHQYQIERDDGHNHYQHEYHRNYANQQMIRKDAYSKGREYPSFLRGRSTSESMGPQILRNHNEIDSKIEQIRRKYQEFAEGNSKYRKEYGKEQSKYGKEQSKYGKEQSKYGKEQSKYVTKDYTEEYSNYGKQYSNYGKQYSHDRIRNENYFKY